MAPLQPTQTNRSRACPKTQRQPQNHQPASQKAHKKSASPAPKTVNLVLDTTDFGRNHGVMVLLDAISKQALFVGEVTRESNALYSHSPKNQTEDVSYLVEYENLFVQSLSDFLVSPLYLATIAEVQEKGKVIQSITGDGRKGFAQLLPGVPVQMCHFHQVQIVNRYLTRNPKNIAACELRALVLKR